MIAFPFQFPVAHFDTPRTALLDADPIAHRCAYFAWKDDMTAAQAREQAVMMAKTWADYAHCTDMIACFSTKPYFRNEIYPQYKSNRKPNEQSKHFDECMDALKGLGRYAYAEKLEADDVLGILATNGEILNPVIVTIDKDLQQVPGWHCNPDKHCFPVRITEAEAAYALNVQTLAGDSTDGVPGIKGVAEKTAMKLLAEDPDPDFHFERHEDYELNRKLVTILTAQHPDAPLYPVQVERSKTVRLMAIKHH